MVEKAFDYHSSTETPDVQKSHSIPRTKFREIVFLFVYAFSFHPQESVSELSELIMNELKVSRSGCRIALQNAIKIMNNKEQLDVIVAEVLVGYHVDRLKSAERAILRVCLSEMVVEDGSEQRPIPPKIAIAEGKRLAKKFATPQASKLIHAVIAAIANKNGLFLEGDELTPAIEENIQKMQQEELLEKEFLEKEFLQKEPETCKEIF